VKAVEYSDALAGELRTELGFDVRTGELVPGLWENRTFDVVALWSVLEHLSNPLETLETTCAYLKPGGVAFLQIPTLYGVQQGERFHQYWALLDLPRHISFFGRKALADLCKKADMELIVWKTPLVETAWCYYASLSNYAHHSRGRRLIGAISLAIFSFFSFPLMVVRAWRGRGTEAFAVAVKR
jgi:SAM-dependent methyltransferase